MIAVAYKGPFDVSVEDVDDPRIEEPLDAIIRITTANICGSDLGDAIDAYDKFDKRVDGYTKVLLHPAG